MTGLLLAAAFALAAPASPPDPRQVAKEVSALLEQGNVNEALATIEAASAADPDPRYLFMRAALEEQLGRCSVAVPLYREFRARTDDPMDEAEAVAGLERCGAEPELATKPQATEPTETTEPAQPPRPTPPSTPATPLPAPSPPWQRDATGWTLLGSGAAVTVVGGVMLGLGNAAARATRSVSSQSEHRALSVRAKQLQPTGIAMIAVGSALWLGGAIRMALVDRGHRAQSAQSRRFEGLSIFF